MDKGVSENNKMCGELKRISNILSNLFLANNFCLRTFGLSNA